MHWFKLRTEKPGPASYFSILGKFEGKLAQDNNVQANVSCQIINGPLFRRMKNKSLFSSKGQNWQVSFRSLLERRTSTPDKDLTTI